MLRAHLQRRLRHSGARLRERAAPPGTVLEPPSRRSRRVVMDTRVDLDTRAWELRCSEQRGVAEALATRATSCSVDSICDEAADADT